METIVSTTPMWAPQTYNDCEPVNRPFDPARLDEVLDVWHFSFFWRRKKPKVEGHLFFGGRNHTSLCVKVQTSAFAVEDALRFVRDFGRHFPVDLSYVHVSHEADAQDLHHYRARVEPFVLGLATPRLRGGLPDLPWAMYFGPPYVQLFSRETLLGAPAAIVEEFPSGVYLQLSEHVADVQQNRDAYERIRAKVKDYLNNDAFVSEASSAPRRVPEFLGAPH